jgi:death-on-curing protein
MTDYLTVVEVLAIHDDQIERYGGASGLRDRGLLEAAIFRPQTGYYADLIEEAAALWESLSQNHPFIDGNKRTASSALSRTDPCMLSKTSPPLLESR